MNIEPFKQPIYVTRPLLPPISELNKKLEEIWSANWLTNNGKQHQILEKEIEKTLKVPHASLFNNGTIALLSAIKALDISGEVITTPFTFPATPHVLFWNNLKPVFCDIGSKDMNIDPDKIESLITKDTSAILAVHVFGTPCNVFKIQEIADKHNLKVIYDSAHAFGAEIDGVGIGNFGDISMFSFHATKLFHTAEGGALTYRNQKFKHLIDLVKNFGIKNEEEVVMTGINGKMNEIQAALGLVVLDCIDDERNRRKEIAEIYTNELKNLEGITLLPKLDNVRPSYQYFVIRIDENFFGKSRDYVHQEFKKYNVFTRKYFYPLCSSYEHYKDFPSSSPKNLPIANKVVKEALSLPFYGALSNDDITKICNILKSIQK